MIKNIFSDGLTRNTTILFILMNIFNFINFIYYLIIARFLVPADYGVLITLISIIYIFNIPSEGIQSIYSRYTSKFKIEKNDGKILYFVKKGLSKGLYYGFIIFIILIPIGFVLSIILDINIWLIIITDLMIFFFILTPIPHGVLQGQKRFTAFGMTFVYESIFRLLFSVFFVFIGWKVYGAITGILVGLALGFIISMIYIKSLFKIEEHKENFSGIYSFSAPYFIMIFVILTAFSIDVILARAFFDPDIVGQYAVLSTLGKVIFLGTSSVGKAMFPYTSERHDAKQATYSTFKKSFFIVLFLSFVVLILYLLIPEQIVSIGFGEQYDGVSKYAFLIGIAMTLLSLTSLILLYGLSINRLRRPWILFIFIMIEITLFSLFHDTLFEYIISFIASNTIMFIGSIFLVK
jgi:O-antigen/teichoic acid export membrane protein